MTRSNGLNRVLRGLRARRDTGVDTRARGKENSAAKGIENGKETDPHMSGFGEKRGRDYSPDRGDQDEEAADKVYIAKNVY